MVGNNIMTHQAIYTAEPGDIIVVDARGHVDTSVWGYIQTVASKVRQIKAVVIDGSIRDIKEIRESGFPVFCRGAVPAGPHKGWGDSVNVPISCGGVSVSPGDLIVGDDDGVVVVPKAIAKQVQKLACERAKMENSWLAEIAKGRSTLEILGLDKKIKDLGVKIQE
jgi:4-hydroxy-4-methyl-2-oxoglutarate aldolase